MEMFFILIALLLVFKGEIGAIKRILNTNVKLEEAKSSITARKEYARLLKEHDKLDNKDKSLDDLYEELMK